jgi:hypothetical protein
LIAEQPDSHSPRRRQLVRPSGITPISLRRRLRGRATNKAAAYDFAANVLPIVRQTQAAGVKSLQHSARALLKRVAALILALMLFGCATHAQTSSWQSYREGFVAGYRPGRCIRVADGWSRCSGFLAAGVGCDMRTIRTPKKGRPSWRRSAKG